MAQAIRLQDLGGKAVVLIGDGEQNEGQMWEAAGYAGRAPARQPDGGV